MILVIMPVIVMLGIGLFIRKTEFVSYETIDGIKKILTQMILPVAIFNALLNAAYELRSWILILALLVSLIVSFVAGFFIKKLVKGPNARYIPYFVSVYEGGMFAYPLFANLCGENQLSKIAILDVACLLFGFSVYMGMLEQEELGGKISVKALVTSAFQNVVFIASILGVVGGLLGVPKLLAINEDVLAVYQSIITIITKPLTPMILIVVGYNMKLNLAAIKASMEAIAWRLAVQIVVIIPMVMATRFLYPDDRNMLYAVIIFMSSPTTFGIQEFLKSKEGSKYVATANSIYTIVTILAYVGVVWVYRMGKG